MITETEREFLIQSNLIEDVGLEGLFDSIAAWEYSKTIQVMTRGTILEIHRLLARHLNQRIAGRFRDCFVRVGSRKCCDPYFIEEEIIRILSNLNQQDDPDLFEKKGDKEEWAKESHIEFEILHPHEDFNGRTGRILMNWQRLKLGLPILIIKHSERFEYYKWFE